MTEEQADKIIELLESINDNLGKMMIQGSESVALLSGELEDLKTQIGSGSGGPQRE